MAAQEAAISSLTALSLWPRASRDSASHPSTSSRRNRQPVSAMLLLLLPRNTRASLCLPLAAMLLPRAVAVGTSPQ